MVTARDKLLEVTEIPSPDTARAHLLSVLAGGGNSGILLEVDKILVKVQDTPVRAVVQSTVINVKVVDAVVNTAIVASNIEAKIDAPDTINVETFSGEGSAPISTNQFSSIFTSEFD